AAYGVLSSRRATGSRISRSALFRNPHSEYSSEYSHPLPDETSSSILGSRKGKAWAMRGKEGRALCPPRCYITGCRFLIESLRRRRNPGLIQIRRTGLPGLPWCRPYLESTVHPFAAAFAYLLFRGLLRQHTLPPPFPGRLQC